MTDERLYRLIANMGFTDPSFQHYDAEFRRLIEFVERGAEYRAANKILRKYGNSLDDAERHTAVDCSELILWEPTP